MAEQIIRTRLAVIDHNTHTLHVEDVDSDVIEKCGGEEEYIRDTYDFAQEKDANFSWDYIVDTTYYPMECDPIDIDFDSLTQ